MNLKHLTLHHNKWVYSRRIPKSIQHRYGGKSHIRRSTGTSDVKAAMIFRDQMDAEFARQVLEEQQTTTRDRFRSVLSELRGAIYPAQSPHELPHDHGVHHSPDFEINANTPQIRREALEQFWERKDHESGKHGFSLLDGAKASAEKAKREGRGAKTIERREIYAKRFLDYLGEKDVPLVSITEQQVAGYIDFRADQGLVRGTINAEVTALAKIYTDSRRVAQGIPKENPFRDQEVLGKDDGHFQSFTKQEVQAILDKTRDMEGYKYLLPRLGMYTGARINELALAGVDAIEQTEHGQWYFDIRESKTKAGIRKVPIHPDILEMVLAQREKGLFSSSKLLFPELAGKNDQRASGWFSSLKTSLGIKNDEKGQKVFHSFRKFLATALQEKDVPISVAKQIVGHEDGSLTYGLYSDGLKIEQLAEHMRGIENTPTLKGLAL
uniref:tyrosine-type recombinase/integrase n=1 Tax=Microbulbifer agarilyticus TaxID=260552 RepID=UPI0003139047|nr:tyrosine-type recombinase/integrase [Microbulbifer agarilyticus]